MTDNALLTDNLISTEVEHNDESPAHPLLRDESLGMNRVTLATGFYGARGERIRHHVHEGALRLPELALHLIVPPDENQEGADPVKQEYVLPGLDSVVRPTADVNLTQLIVTEVVNEDVSQEVISPEDGTIQSVTFSKTVSRNRLVLRDTPTERIRGGAETDETALGDANRTAQIVDTTILTTATANSASASTVAGASSAVGNMPVPSLQIPTAPVAMNPPTPNVAAPALSIPDGPPAVQTLPVSAVVENQMNTDTKPNGTNGNPSAVSLTASNPVAAGAPPLPIPSTEPAIQVLDPTTTMSSPPSVVSRATADVQPSVDKPPNAVSSSDPASLNTDDLSGRVIPLKKRPPPQWDQRKIDTPVVSSPDWYQQHEASSIERATLSEWFDGSAVHRTPETFLRARKTMMEMSVQLGPSRYFTATLARRSIPGDAGSLLRMHAFLTTYGLINADTTNETTPAPAILQKKAVSWEDNTLRESLMRAVVDVSRKRPRLTGSSEFMPMDWNAVATAVGHGTTPTECERQFLSMPINANDGTATSGDGRTVEHAVVSTPPAVVLQDLVEGTDLALLSTVVNAALCHTNSVSQAQSAGTVGLACSKALEVARSEENAVARIMAEIVDLRMRKLENRMELLDEMEGMLVAERVDLELERRDLYTARCRHWFGGT